MFSITRTQLEILQFLLNQEEPQNIRGIAKKLGKSYALVYNAIQDLEQKKVICKQAVPPTQIITLHEYAPRDILIAAENAATEGFIKKYRWVKLFTQDVIRVSENAFFCLLVFGSYAKRKATNSSDIDFITIVPTKEDITSMEKAIMQVYTKVKKQIIIVSQDDFVEMIKNSKQFNVGNEAVKHHVILTGYEQYYALLEKRKL